MPMWFRGHACPFQDIRIVISLVIAAVVLVWFVRQFSGKRAKKWERRGKALIPALRHLAADVAVLVRYAKTWREVRRMRRELRDLK